MKFILWMSAIAACVLGLRMMIQLLGRVLPDKAHTLVRRGAMLLDVRGRMAFGSTHLPRARNIPFDELGKRMREVGAHGHVVVVYSDSGGESASAASMLRKAGFTNVHDLGPMSRWADGA